MFARALLGRWTLGIALLALSAGAASAHPHAEPPPASLAVYLTEGELELSVLIRKRIVLGWLLRDDDFHNTAENMLPHASKAIIERCTVLIDGTEIDLDAKSFEEVRDTEFALTVRAYHVTFKNPLPKRPKKIVLRWLDFADIRWDGEQVVPLIVDAGRQLDSFQLTADEPEYVWHPEWTPGTRAPVALVAGARPAPPEDHRHWLSIALVVVLGIGLVWRPRAQGPRIAVAAAVLSLAVLWFAMAPDKGPASILPSEAQAGQIFETLHENVYRAFDAQSDDEIYDLLAKSVEAPLLDPLFGDVKESLVMREQGGAVCRVERIERLDRRVELPSESWARHFRVDASWRVFGSVAHYGHVHRRVNRYAATFAVRHDGASWKIADVEVTEHDRVDDPEADDGEGTDEGDDD